MCSVGDQFVLSRGSVCVQLVSVGYQCGFSWDQLGISWVQLGSVCVQLGSVCVQFVFSWVSVCVQLGISLCSVATEHKLIQTEHKLIPN